MLCYLFPNAKVIGYLYTEFSYYAIKLSFYAMTADQQNYIASIDSSASDEIYIKKTMKEGINLPPHSHNKHQIIFTLSGTLHIQIGTMSYFVPERHIAWIPEKVEHKLSSNNQKIALQMFHCNMHLKKNDPRQQFAVYNADPLILANLKFISSASNIISKRGNEDMYYYATSFFRLLSTMSTSYTLPLKALVLPDDQRLRPVLDFINRHLQEDLTVESVAREFGFSERNLSRLFLKSDIRFNSYLNYQRITRAIELFADGNKTMQEIAYEVGYNTPNNFNRVFKKITGKTPSHFCANA